ncbi:MAG TPA: alpha-glucuronidase family glycosyl hydrolase [Chitinophagaceae bacterium]|nr:alpha-glucuronidase family glycosyl hydrolase [Chitinophagaceae bacterium]
MKKIFYLFYFLSFTINMRAEDGYRLWLRYDLVQNKTLLNKYRAQVNACSLFGNSEIIEAARNELSMGLSGLLGGKIPVYNVTPGNAAKILFAGTPTTSAFIASLPYKEQLQQAGKEGYIIITMYTGSTSTIIIAANNDIGVLYGCFHFLRLLQTEQDISQLKIVSAPKIQNRILDHWDNLTRYIERGYAGISIWDWQRLPDYLDQRYADYARANASIGINGTVLTNVNANSWALSPLYLVKVAALAKVFRHYGIKVYLTARFSAPIDIGGLKTADPFDAEVKAWWKKKVDEIYQHIPDFGGFLVKANSEGQPGPQSYGRNHADGANMMADALAPHGGIVMWRAFVYSSDIKEDRYKQAYNEFKPLDGQFRKNVMVQVKYGPIDFQPREPIHPLFGAMPQTPLVMEFQLTQEYLGFATHLVYMGQLFKEMLNTDTYVNGPGSTVAKIIDGSLDHYNITGIAAVANIGNEKNWTGHPFGQANWYAFGRMAWDHTVSPSQVATEWIRATFTNDKKFVTPVLEMMMGSRENMVNYMTPLGLHHIMGYGHHYGPAPWYDKALRADWNPVYFHRADSAGIGFDRTSKGSDALGLYAPGWRRQYEDMNTCPEEFLLWFHHVPWNHKMRSGNTLWEELCFKYYSGTDGVLWMQKAWQSTKGLIDNERFEQVNMLLKIQVNEAIWWRNACLLYFQTFSRQPIPGKYEKPDHALDYYEALRFPYAPGNAQ